MLLGSGSVSVTVPLEPQSVVAVVCEWPSSTNAPFVIKNCSTPSSTDTTIASTCLPNGYDDARVFSPESNGWDTEDEARSGCPRSTQRSGVREQTVENSEETAAEGVEVGSRRRETFPIEDGASLKVSKHLLMLGKEWSGCC